MCFLRAILFLPGKDALRPNHSIPGAAWFPAETCGWLSWLYSGNNAPAMPVGTIIRKPWVKWPLFMAFWTLIALSFASQFYISSSKAGVPVSWRQALSYALGDWYVFAFLSLPVIGLAHRFRFDEGAWRVSLAVHVTASLLFSAAYILLRSLVGQWQSSLGGAPVTFAEAVRPLLVKTWHFNLIIYWVIVSVTLAFDYYRKYQERELRAAELERRLTQARLQALQMQLNPHFLFNTLHSISSLMHRDVEAADEMITRFGDLLRLALESGDTQEVSLRDELAFAQRYLEIEQTRFGDRLSVRMEIAPETLRAQVPNLILQPLLENAIRHGIEPHARPGRIEVRTSLNEGVLRLAVTDNGQGISSGEDFEEGVGLSNTRARLEQLYGRKHRFELRPAEDGGLAIQIEIPFHTPS